MLAVGGSVMGWHAMRRVGVLGAAAGLVLAISGTALPVAAASAPGPTGPTRSSAPRPEKRFKTLVPHSVPTSTRAGDRLRLHSRKPTGPVALSPKVYIVFWGRQWANETLGAATKLQNLFRGLGGADDTWSSVMSQYCSKLPKKTALPAPSCLVKSKHIVHSATSPLAGVWFDNATAEPDTVDGFAISAEATRAAQHFGNTRAALNRNAVYVIANAPKTLPDGFPQFCGYHSWVNVTKLGQLAYVNLPYVPDIARTSCTLTPNPGPLDGYTVTASHEYAETVTDFVFDSPTVGDGGWWSGTGDSIEEIGDLCSDGVNDDLAGPITLDTGTFVVEGLFSNATGTCVLSG